MRPTIQTYTGLEFDVTRLDPALIRIEDIAHALSCMPRFAGHTQWFYSVAQHSVHVSQLVPPHLAKAALLHDAAEAYILDMPTPIKAMLPAYRGMEDEIMQAVGCAFHLGIVKDSRPFVAEWECAAVKRADMVALATEKRDLMRNASWWSVPVEPDEARIVPLLPQQAEQLFLARWAEVNL